IVAPPPSNTGPPHHPGAAPRLGRPGRPTAVSEEHGRRDGAVSGRVRAMFATVHRMWWWTAHPAAH
ncbi:trp operon leader peptide, partial [Streptomyces griseoaurantiacus]|uniref:trp operon leader peptide n=1 Tax=Streptomyces griseoaurantiacus TaxID=68213 RepID=UPI003649ADF9